MRGTRMKRHPNRGITAPLAVEVAELDEQSDRRRPDNGIALRAVG